VNPRQRRGLVLLGLSLVGLIGVFALVASYVSEVRAEVEPKVQVLTLTENAPPFRALRPDMVELREMPERYVPRTALREVSDIVGLVPQTELVKESILQDGMLTAPPDLAAGQREIATLVDAETGVAGKVGPGSIVDIVASFPGDEDTAASTEVVVPGARVVDVGQTRLKGGNGVQGGGNADPQQVVPVTFALTPREELIVTYAEAFAQEVRLARLRPGERSELSREERVYRRGGGTREAVPTP